MPRFALQRTLIGVSGPDSRTFLQGLLTQDIDRLEHEPVQYAAILSPQGKVSADMFVWARADGSAVLDVDPARGEALLRKLSMYKLRAQVSLEEVSKAHVVLVSDAPFEGAAPDPRLAALGWRGLASPGAHARGEEWMLGRRIAEGVPDLAIDAAPEEVFGLEALLEELNGVAFAKGCFVGQENVSRMKRRATTRKKFCPIVFDGPPPPPGTPIRAGEAELGTVRSGLAGRAMAFLRLDRALEAGDGGKTLSAGEQTVRIDPPPWLILPPREAPAD